MRTKTSLLMLAASTLGACKWTEFDDLEGTTWVEATTKPNVKSSDYGVAIQRGARSGDGGRLVVLGTGEATYSELAYSAKGEDSFPATTVSLKQIYGIPNIPQQPLLIADPTTDDISLFVASDNGVALFTGAQGTLKLYQFFNQAAPDGATYVLAPGRAAPLPLLAVGDTVLGAFLPALPMNMAQPTCKLIDSTAPATKLALRALGAVRIGATDDVLAWDGGGKLYRYPSSVFGGCAVPQAELDVVDTGFGPEAGAQILPVDANTVLLQGHRGDAGYLQLFNATTLDPIGQPVMVPKLRQAAILEVVLEAGSTQYVAAGVPTAIVDGKAAGQVVLHEITQAGIDAVPAATFSDAQPESNESFGRSVAVMPFNGKQVLAVAADNEIFVYFRANLTNGTVLYDETRQGR